MPTLAALDAPNPRLVDGAILVLVGFEVASGLASLLVATPDAGWVPVLHGVVGVTLSVFLYWKFRRVWPRVVGSAAWDRATPISVLLATVALVALATGLAWTLLGRVRIAGFPLLVVHMVLGVLVVPILLGHLIHRLRLPSTRDFEGRRTTLRFGATLVGAGVAWRSKEAVGTLAGVAGADRRFTGSKRVGGDGNEFPATSWLADDPDPLDVEDWRLDVGGEVERPLGFSYGDLTVGNGGEPPASTTERVDAVLDCTSGWYAERTWEGVRLGSVLDAVEPTADGQWVRVRSVTGYRWSFPIEEAREMLLATAVDGERLSHGHGAPVRLVAPGRRGFQWVKWVDRIEVARHEDLSQWIAMWVSGLD